MSCVSIAIRIDKLVRSYDTYLCGATIISDPCATSFHTSVMARSKAAREATPRAIPDVKLEPLEEKESLKDLGTEDTDEWACTLPGDNEMDGVGLRQSRETFSMRYYHLRIVMVMVRVTHRE